MKGKRYSAEQIVKLLREAEKAGTAREVIRRYDITEQTFTGGRSMYVLMVSVFLMSVVWGVSPTTCGSAPFTRRNPRLTRRADTLFTFIISHTD